MWTAKPRLFAKYALTISQFGSEQFGKMEASMRLKSTLLALDAWS
jgi:hypothetical protein